MSRMKHLQYVTGSPRDPDGLQKYPIKLWQCPICGDVYGDAKDAGKCSDRGREWLSPIVNVGDLVTIDPDDYGSMGWYDGLDDWVIQKPRGLHSEEYDPGGRYDGYPRLPYYSLIYVVTAIEQHRRGAVSRSPGDGHEAIYYLVTLAMTGAGGYRGGYTFAAAHNAPRFLGPAKYGIGDDRWTRIKKQAAVLVDGPLKLDILM